jgi:hypothetical protein
MDIFLFPPVFRLFHQVPVSILLRAAIPKDVLVQALAEDVNLGRREVPRANALLKEEVELSK